MKILFDQGTPAPLREFLHPHVTAHELGWGRLRNGDLSQAAESEGFETMVTTDSNLKHEQNLPTLKNALVVLLSTSWPKIQKKIPEVRAAVEAVVQDRYSEVPI